MVLVNDGGGSAAGQVQVIIDEIEAIGRRHLPGAQDDASVATQDFRNLELDPSSFGEVPIARSLGVQHGAAHEVFVATVDTVLQDLNDFASMLVASMKAHQATDEGVHSALIAFNGSYGERGSRAEETFQEKLAEQGEQLHVDDQQGGADSSADDMPAGENGTPGESSTEFDSGESATAESLQSSGEEQTTQGDQLWVSPLLPNSVAQPSGTGY